MKNDFSLSIKWWVLGVPFLLLTPLGLAGGGGRVCTSNQGSVYTTPPETLERIQDIEATEWVSLFNGKNLEGWFATGGNKEAFYVQDGAIECNGKGGGWLLSEDEYEDFILELEFKISQGGNSGVCIRSTREGNPAFTGMELQVLDDYGQPSRNNTTGAVYGSITPMVNMSRPAGEWNQERIECVDRTLRVWLNGVKIVDINLDQHDALKNRVPAGHVGVQDHGNYVWYRNIRIKTLPEEE